MVAKSGNGWRLAPSLVALIDQVDALFPGRSRLSDGSIGDAAHAKHKSDHNPSNGYVTAVDVTHDPDGGFDSYGFAELLRVRQDPRVKYVISNGHTFSGPGGKAPYWQWRPYTGANKHSQHVHVSVNTGGINDTAPWFSDAPATTPPTGRRLLKRGVRGDDVRGWQTILVGAGLLSHNDIDGIFGPRTEAATKEFQQALGVTADGIVGPNTVEATERLFRYMAAAQ